MNQLIFHQNYIIFHISSVTNRTHLQSQTHTIGKSVCNFHCTVHCMLLHRSMAGWSWRRAYGLSPICVQHWRKHLSSKYRMGQWRPHHFSSSSVYWIIKRWKRANKKCRINFGQLIRYTKKIHSTFFGEYYFEKRLKILESRSKSHDWLTKER